MIGLGSLLYGEGLTSLAIIAQFVQFYYNTFDTNRPSLSALYVRDSHCFVLFGSKMWLPRHIFWIGGIK